MNHTHERRRRQPPRPRSRPVAWRKVTRRGWRHPVRDARSRAPKGLLTFWTRARRLLWSWWPWAIVSIWAIGDARWGWAIGAGAMALVSYLIAPPAAPPRYGLDHEFAVDSPEFVRTVAGASGSPFLDGQLARAAQQRRRLLSADARGDQGARTSRSRSRPTSTGRATSDGASPRRWRNGRRRVARSRSCSTRSARRASVPRSSSSLEAGGCQVAWYNPIRWYTLGRFNNRTHRKSLIVDGRVAFTGGAGIADHWRGNARGPDEWRDMQIRLEGPAVVPLQTGFAHNWQQTTGELLSGDAYYPTHRRRRPAGRADAPELAGNRRLERADDVLPVDRLCARVDLHRQSVLRARSGRASRR